MNNRGLIILLAVAVLLIAITLTAERGSAPASQNAELVPGLQAALNDIERMTVVKAGGETVATLERRPDTWVVMEKNAYRADVAKIRQNLIALAEAKVIERKTANPELYDRLGVEDIAGGTAAGIAISFAASNRELPTLILGNAEGTKYRYARRAGEEQSFLIDRDPDVPRSASQWVDATILDVRGERVQQVTITHPDGEVVALSKASPAAPNFDVANIPAGRELMYPGVANVVGNALRELNLEDVEALDAGADAQAAPEVVTEFRTFDGLIVTVRGVEQDGQSWVTFAAAFSADQAAQFAAGAAGGDGAATVDVSAEAQSINERVSAWRYRIANHQYEQITRALTDLLKPAA